MSRIAYNILDPELIYLFDFFFPGVKQELGGEWVVPASEYQGYLDTIQAALEEDYTNELWDYWDEIDEDVRIWSTEKNAWE